MPRMLTTIEFRLSSNEKELFATLVSSSGKDQSKLLRSFVRAASMGQTNKTVSELIDDA